MTRSLIIGCMIIPRRSVALPREAEMSDLVCEHGSLRRKCEICERDERIKELEEALRELMVFCTSGEAYELADRVLRGEER